MSKVIDERVVEMRFDNKQFESATKNTLSTLGKLKEALKLPSISNAFSGIDKAAKNVSLNGIAASLEALEKRFSTLGIVGMRVIENITDGLMNKLSSAVHYATDAIVSGGLKRAMNIENAHFQLQALLKDEAKVQEVMDDAMTSVDGTAYAFDEAAKAASQFSASGIQAGDEMLGALKGITGVAAMTNSSFEDVSRIFTTVAGNGRLMGDQLLQLSSRGLNAASTLSDYFKEVRGESSMTEAEIRDMVSHGQLDFRTFAEAMQWAFGESAERANETFTGALANMRSALARIGAGFISPFIEQESDLVKLFNVLRIQINNVKAALVFDEQKSAISGLTKQTDLLVETTSELLIDGRKDFDTFTKAILGTTKTEKELSEANEALSTSYEMVKENGYASVDTLIEFNKYGINATKSLKDYLNGVMDGSIKASEEVKDAVNEITGGVRVMSGDITKYAEEGKLNYKVFANAIVNSSGLVQNGTELATEAITFMLKKVEEQGFVTTDTLIDFNKNGVNAAVALTKYMNGVTDGSIRASYATTQAVNEITKGTKLASGSITELAEQGVISYDILQSALEEMYGDQKKLSKEFTEFALDIIKKVKKTVEAWDLSGPIKIFYHGVESVKNLAKGVYTVIVPLADAFEDVFSSFSMDTMVSFASKIENVTKKIRLSEKQGENLRKTFKGLFSIAKLLVDIFIALIKVIIPINEPVGSLADGLLSITAAIGENLTKFTEWVKSSPMIAKAYERISDSIHKTMKFLSDLINGFGDFVKKVKEIPAVTKIIDAISDAFSDLGKIFEPVFGDIGKSFKNFFKDIEDSIPTDAQEFFDTLLGDIESFANSIDQDKLLNFLTEFTNKVKDFVNFIQSNDKLNIFVNNAEKFFENLSNAFSIEELMNKIDKVQERLDKFVTWIKETVGPFFEGFTFGNALAATGSGGLLYVLVKLAKSFEKWGNVFQSIPKAFTALKNVLVEYQKNLKADTLLKIAESIGILAVSLTLLSFADTKGLIQAVIALVIVGGLFVTALAIFNKVVGSIKKLPAIEKYIGEFANNISKAALQLGKAAKWKMIAKTISAVGSSILKIAVSIVGLGLIAQKNPQAIEDGIYLVSGIAAGIGIMIYAVTKIGDMMTVGMQSFSKATSGVLAMCLGIIIMTQAIKMLMKLELPSDGTELAIKLGMLGSAVFGIAVLIYAIGKASKIAEGNKIKMGPILAAAGSVIILVKALEVLNGINLGSDAVAKILIFAGIFTAFGLLIQVIGESAKNAGGALKATGTLLALSVAIIAIVGALSILTLLPTDKLFAASVDLGIVLGMLAVALLGAGQIANGSNYKTVLTMGVIIAALSVSLSILSMIPWTSLIPAAAALGIVLLGLATVFAGIGSIKTINVPEIIAMMVMVGEIAYILYQLAPLPWGSLIAAGGALAVALVGVSAALFIAGKTKVDIGTIIGFVTGCVALISAAYAINMIAGYNWGNLIAAAGALAIASLALAGSIAIIGKNPLNIVGVLSFVIGAIALLPIASVIQQLSGLSFAEVATGLLTLAGGLVVIGVAGLAFGAMAAPMIAGAAALISMSVAVAAAGVAILAFVWSVTTALNLLGEFIMGVVNGIGNIAEVGKNVVLGFVGGVTGGLGSVWDSAKELGNGFIEWIKNIFGIHSPSDVMEEIASFIIQGFNIGISKGESSVTDTVKGVFGGLSGLIDTSSLKSSGEGMAKSFTDGILNKKDFVSSLVKSVTDGKEIETDTTVYEQAGQEASTSFTDGFMSGSFDAEAMIKEVMSGAGLDFDYSKYIDMGGLASGSFLEGFSGGEYGDLSMDMSAIMNGAMDDFDYTQYYDTGKEGGSQFLEGFQTGSIENTQKVANEIIEALANEIAKFAKQKNLENVGLDMLTSIMKAFKESGKTVTSDMKVFTESIKNETDSVIPHITNTVNVTSKDLISKINTLCHSVLKIFQDGWNQSTMKQIGEDLIQNITSGIQNKQGIFTNSIQKLSSDTITSFKSVWNNSVFNQIGRDLVQYIINGVQNRRPVLITNVQTLCTNTINRFKTIWNASVFSNIGQSLISYVISGINMRRPNLMNLVQNMSLDVINRFKNVWNGYVFSQIGRAMIQYIIVGMYAMSSQIYNASYGISHGVVSIFQQVLTYQAFYYLAQSAMSGVVDGIYSKQYNAITAAQNVCQAINAAALNGLSYNDFYNAGSNVSMGLAHGISSRVQDISNTAYSAAQAAISAVKGAFAIASPSRVMFGIGEYVSQGLANGIQKDSVKVIDSIDDMSGTAIRRVNNTLKILDSYIDKQSVNRTIEVKAVMDLTDLKRDTEEMNDMFNKSINEQVRTTVTPVNTVFLLDKKKQEEQRTATKINEAELRQWMTRMYSANLGPKNENTFYIQGEDPRTIAEEVSTILNRQIERKQTTWA